MQSHSRRVARCSREAGSMPVYGCSVFRDIARVILSQCSELLVKEDLVK